jgi:DNA-binding response OmpR family regulator
MRVTIVSEDNELSDFLSYVARRAGYEVRYRSLPQPASSEEPAASTDLLILHLKRGMGEVKLLEVSRSQFPGPILAVLPKMDEDGRAAMLDAGADALLELPVGPRLCRAAMQALLRRTRTLPTSTLPLLDFGLIRLNPGTRSVTTDGHETVRLTELEFRLLQLLMTHPGQVMPSEVIVDRVWGYGESGGKELVRGVISRLRAKIEPDPSAPRFVHTIPTVGYFFDPGAQ